MDTAAVRNLLLSTKLQEKAVVVPGWEGANLIIRELSGKAGSDLIAASTDADTNKLNQDAFIAGIILATLRNADDENKALVFGKDGEDAPNPVYRDGLMSTGLGRIMQVAKMSIDLSGLNEAAQVDAAKNASSVTQDAASPSA
jgi:hypothetical protein